MFYEKQSKGSQKIYQKYLKAASKLSPLTSDNLIPNLNYRTSERIFNAAFEATDVSRGDDSVDSVKENQGIGIKTFIRKGNSDSLEKITEFNDRNKYPLPNSNDFEIIKTVSGYRNQRIEETIKKYQLDAYCYHYIVRDIEKFYICESEMPFVDMSSLKLDRLSNGHIIKFSDKHSIYQFNTTKSTMYMRFKTSNPVDFVDLRGGNRNELIIELLETLAGDNHETESVVLPLFSTRIPGYVPEKSGLNQWNASGRPRDSNEIYIPIPRAVHLKHKGFFPKRDIHFELITNDGRKLKAKVCQENDKALMTDPNSDLGKWLLRDVLKIAPKKLVTYKLLEDKGFDTVIVHKLNEFKYKIEPHNLGSYNEE